MRTSCNGPTQFRADRRREAPPSAAFWRAPRTSRRAGFRPQRRGRRERYVFFRCLLGPDIAGIQAARDRGVGGSFDDGTSVRKQGDFIGLAEEFEYEVVVPHIASRLQAGADLDEVNGALALVDLNGIPAA